MKNFLYKNLNNEKLKYIYFIFGSIFFLSFGYLIGSFSSKGVVSLASASASPVAAGSLLSEVKSYIDDNFIPWKSDNKLPTDEDLAYGIVKGYVNSYNDPYTQFFTPTESKQFEEDIKGSFGGIGALIGYKDKNPVIMSVLKDTPAEKAGLKSGDILISVDGKTVGEMSTEEIVRLVRGEIGTTVNIEVFHKNSTKSSKVAIVRAEIKTPILESEIKNDVFIIHFYSFTEDSAARFEKLLQQFISSGKKKLVIDVRGNGGGYLDSAVQIASLFLPKDKVVLVEKNSKNSGDTTTYSKGYDYLKGKSVKVYVFIDGGSASASEILAGALKDNGVAKIIGEKSFGKGSVQQLIKISDGSDLKVTVAKWYTPNGVNISESGITPDIIATSSEKIELDKSGKIIDTQLLKAINIIKTQK